MRVTLEKKLRRCPLFDGIADLSFLTRCAQPLLQRLEPGQSPDWQGGGLAAVVVDGRVRAGPREAGPGEVLGLEAALLGGPGPDVTALRAARLLLLPAPRLIQPCPQCCPGHLALAANAARLLAGHAAALERRQGYLLIRGVRARLMAYLEDRRREAGSDIFTLPMSRRALAEYLNLARPSLSRELCALRDEGMLEFYRETVRFLVGPERAEGG